MSIKIKDISRELGLSVSTVSKALNGYRDVSEETRERVMEAAQQLGYQPNAAARSLRRRRTDKIGLLINTSIAYMSDYVAQTIPGAASAAEARDSDLVLYTSAVGDPLAKLQRVCQSREVDGILLIWSDRTEEAIAFLQARTTIPYVVFGRRVADPTVSFVAPDNRTGAYELTRHLIELGHSKIGFTTRPALSTTNEDRLAGYKMALAEAGLPFDETYIVETAIEPQSGYLAMNALLDLSEPPTAVFAFHDYVAVDAHRAVLERGLRIPEDVAIVGFDGLRATLLTSPPITTVAYSLFEMGQRAIEILLQNIVDRHGESVQHIQPTSVLVRGSTSGVNVSTDLQ